MIPPLSLHPFASMPCGMDWPLLQSRPGSKQARDSRTNPVQVAPNALTHRSNHCSHNITAPLPEFGTDRMWDFEQVGAANLWKSGPFFSTGAKVTELGMVELRLNLCSRARNTKLPRGRGSRRRWAVILTPGCPQHLQKAAAYCKQPVMARVERETGPPAQRIA